ncbi:MAG: hypothetical protein A7316_00350 [Candidatus Altiarchaeales archaeon WOR_SM1_86-2]|nr:MAG: hypothetical protein A7316_00350 [Candidatus Altiarchaeales archaeon WOR_SM1_86-2]ODS41318.1 MAG: hypothetical protein A7315_06660 [Candidatus Altiarchaeales archaeon WOR_SM1_79]
MDNIIKKGFYKRARVNDALNILIENVNTLGTEKVKIKNSPSRVLAKDIKAPFDIPPFDRSAVDGYAVKAENTFGASQTNPVYFKITGSAPIGKFPDIKVNDFEAVKVMTGTPIPEGADGVVMFEYTRESGGRIEVIKPLSPGRNISFRGEDVRKGDILLERGMPIRPQDVGMLASFGMTDIPVHKKPKVAIISTGDELINPEENLTKGKIFDSNSYMLTALILKYNGFVEKTYTLKDDYNLIREKIQQSLDSNCDLILLTGGTSAGEHDFIPWIVNELGRILVHGISMRPGMPTGFGIVDEKIIFMLPGNPAAVFAAFEFFIISALQKMGGMKIGNPHHVIECTLKRKIPSMTGRSDFVRVRVEKSGGENFAEPVRSGGSGLISSLVKTQGFVIVPENKEGFEKGEKVKVNLY